MTDLPHALFSTPEMVAVFSGESHVRQLLAFEAALARAEAGAGVIPAAAARAIAQGCQTLSFDAHELFRQAVPSGTLAIPLVRALTQAVEGEGKRYVHWGATSQDAIDTAVVLQMRDGLRLLHDDLLRLAEACAGLAERHRQTLMVARTLLQQALPITFGLKAARWLAASVRQLERLRELQARVLVVQLGGAAGTLAALRERGPRTLELLAQELDLAAPELPWHAERDRPAEVAAALGVLAGTMAKIAGDLALLAQTEVGEVAEAAAEGKGGSSAMPQKRNPVDAMEALAAARLAIGTVPVVLGAMAQEHERAVGGWQAEWGALPDAFRYTAGAVARVRAAVSGLEVDAERMRANLKLTGGQAMAEALSMALAEQVGRPEAQRLVQAASRRALESGLDLRQAAQEELAGALAPEALDRALDPAQYLGASEAFIERALDSYRRVSAQLSVA